MKIQILGMGCPKCKKLEENTKKALQELKISAEVEKVTDVERISQTVMLTPALVIDSKVLSEGRIPEPNEIKKWLAGKK